MGGIHLWPLFNSIPDSYTFKQKKKKKDKYKQVSFFFLFISVKEAFIGLKISRLCWKDPLKEIRTKRPHPPAGFAQHLYGFPLKVASISQPTVVKFPDFQ